MKKIKFKTEFSGNFDKFVSNSGNGEAVPQYELNENNIVVPKLDKNGKQVFHNLTADIQLNKNTNDYKKLLESGVNPQDIKVSVGNYIDTTQIGRGVDLLNAQARLEASGLTMDDIGLIMDDLIKKNTKKKEIKKQEPQKQEQVKKDEVK